MRTGVVDEEGDEDEIVLLPINKSLHPLIAAAADENPNFKIHIV